MSSIDLGISPQQKLAIARQYTEELTESHKSIEAVIVSGSVVRGTAIPPSDVDMWYMLSDGVQLSDVCKGIYRGVCIDIEQFPTEGSTAEQILSDSYVLGYVTGAAILYDRNGSFTRLMQQVDELRQDDSLRRVRLSKLSSPIRRNLFEFRQSLQTKDEREVCRASSFALWCLADYLLAKDDKPPGGFRVLSRLQTHRLDAYRDIIDMQGSKEMDAVQVGRLVEVFAQHQKHGTSWLDKQSWMLKNGLKDEVFQSLTINLGLSVKDSNADKASVTDMCKRLIASVCWTWEKLEDVVTAYDNRIGRYLGE
jgi:hypothetical protein